jgi:polyferredoxin
VFRQLPGFQEYGEQVEKADWAKKLILLMVTLLFLFIPILILGAYEQNGLFASFDPLVLLLVNLIPIIIAIGMIYSIYKAHTIN